MQLKVLLLFHILLFTPFVYSQNIETADLPSTALVTPEEIDATKKTMLSALVGFSYLSYNGRSQIGADLAFSINYALQEKFGLIGIVRQSLAVDALSNLFTELTFGVSYLLQGSLSKKASKMKIQNVTVLESETASPRTIYLGFLAKQYFFNASNTVLPLTGLGVSGTYRFPTVSGVDIEAGTEISFVSNGAISILPIKIFVGIGFWP